MHGEIGAKSQRRQLLHVVRIQRGYLQTSKPRLGSPGCPRTAGPVYPTKFHVFTADRESAGKVWGMQFECARKGPPDPRLAASQS